MKKTVLSVLIVLLLSFVMFGCGKECEVCGENPCICKDASKSNLVGDVLVDLGKLGFTASDVLCPVGTTFYDYEYFAATNKINIYWTDANESMYNYYKDAWLALPDRGQNVSQKSVFASANIEFYAEQDEGYAITIPAGTIAFLGTK